MFDGVASSVEFLENWITGVNVPLDGRCTVLRLNNERCHQSMRLEQVNENERCFFI